MSIILGILVVYFAFQLSRGGNNGMFTKLKATWFEAQYGEGSVVKATRDCPRPYNGMRLRVKFKSRFLRRNKEDTVLVQVPYQFASAGEATQDAVLAEILGRAGLSISAIESIEEVEETLPAPEDVTKLKDA